MRDARPPDVCDWGAIAARIAAAFARMAAVVARAQAVYEELAETDPAGAEAFGEAFTQAIAEARAASDARALIERARRTSREQPAVITWKG